MKSFAIYDHGVKYVSCGQGTFKHMVTGAGRGTKQAFDDCSYQIKRQGFDTRILEPALDALEQLEGEYHFITVRWS